MGLFGSRYKNNDEKYLSLESFYHSIGDLIKLDYYISKKEYTPYVKKASQSRLELITYKKGGLLLDWCKKTKSDPKKIDMFLNAYDMVDDTIKKHNDLFVDKHLETDKDYLDRILKSDDPNICLDLDQRTAVLSDEDYTLLVAGAGAGKTTTIEAKAKYLVDKRQVDPNRILVVSFTRKATQELKERFKKINISAHISTFHSIGNDIISKSEVEDHTIKGSGFSFETINSYLKTQLKDETFIKKILLFFASYLQMPFDSSKSIEIYKRFLAKDNISTIKEDISRPLDEYKDELIKKKITFKSERVRSVEECQIANFLYINGIDYEYEAVYPYRFIGSSKPYCPDFKLTQGEHVAYLEHYGITEDGQNWRFNEEELNTYKKEINDKYKLHKLHQTELLWTFSSYKDGIGLIEHLRQELIDHGFELNERKNVDIYKQLAISAEDRYFSRLVQLLCNFINRFKTNNYKAERFSDFKTAANMRNDSRTALFLDIAYQCYLNYEQALKDKHAIDFEDMINNASDLLDAKIASHERLPFDYIFIDEYQDISMQRFNLAEKLAKASDAKIVAVGDDWQSIYRFSGSDITLFTDFESKMGYADVKYLRGTHRNSQELVDIAGKFVMANDLQKKKSLVSSKHIKDPVVIMSYDDTFKPTNSGASDDDLKTPYWKMGEAIEEALGEISTRYGDKGKVLLIGRYNFDGKNLSKLSDLFTYDNTSRKVSSLKYPKMDIVFMTAHSSKGLGFDNVIVINGKDDVLGFPSKIEDDPVMKLVIRDAKEIDYAEERRLFYVALTRTKNQVYVIAPKTKPSEFVLELRDHFKNIILNGPALEPIACSDYRYKCPICGYPLQKRSNFLNRKKGTSLWVCSNDPEICGFVTNDISGGKMSIQKCPKCESGYLIVKKIKVNEKDTGRRLLGCSNYSADGNGCDFTIDDAHYHDKWEMVAREQAEYKRGLPLDACILAGYPVKQLIAMIVYIVDKTPANASWRFSMKGLIDFMIGKNDSKFIAAFNLKDAKGFGCVDASRERLLYAINKSLIEFGILEVIVRGNYQDIMVGSVPDSDEMARKVYEVFLLDSR